MEQTTDNLWERAKAIFLGTLQSDNDRSRAKRHLEAITKVVYKDGIVTFYTSTEFGFEYIRDNYIDKLKTSFELAGEKVEFNFKKDESISVDIKTPVGNSTATNVDIRNKIISTMPMNADYTFKEFVQGSSNSFALAAAKSVAKKPGKQPYYNPLFIHGGTGLGKTHLMQAIGHEIAQTYPNLSVCYLTTETFLNEYINALENGQIHNFRNRYRNVDVLLLDDVQFLPRGKQNFQEEFFNTFQDLQRKEKQIVMTSDVAPSKMQNTIEERLISRFQGGMVQEIESPSYETRLAILRKKAKSMELDVPSTVFEYIADHVTSHVRAMEGALVKISIVHSADPSIVFTTNTLSYILKDIIEKEQTKIKLTVEDIQSKVAKCFNVPIEAMTSETRTQSMVTPRQLAMFISRKLTTKSLQDIAKIFGKSHATIVHGVKNISQRIDTEEELRIKLEQILAEFGYKLSDVID